MESCDVVIVGAGIGGSALAKALADDGLGVVVLEQSEVYEDRVRGESMVPWGVAEARSSVWSRCCSTRARASRRRGSTTTCPTSATRSRPG